MLIYRQLGIGYLLSEFLGRYDLRTLVIEDHLTTRDADLDHASITFLMSPDLTVRVMFPFLQVFPQWRGTALSRADVADRHREKLIA